ncbi:MAG: hypothetical protein BTN85_0544 [Candidatus Methanohalarchaeum thermophilum]|uniref:Uncharacterized protein n=1 Tax=Methanohalarchaeum thermophilum TaxID=1903181 RepID=A0A1Q6DUK4_METT1|nr:MAG: hypothetical protein BTN85_0544 [Candidatus Methanohalarchaeum thermophilum]
MQCAWVSDKGSNIECPKEKFEILKSKIGEFKSQKEFNNAVIQGSPDLCDFCLKAKRLEKLNSIEKLAKGIKNNLEINFF